MPPNVTDSQTTPDVDLLRRVKRYRFLPVLLGIGFGVAAMFFVGRVQALHGLYRYFKTAPHGAHRAFVVDPELGMMPASEPVETAESRSLSSAMPRNQADPSAPRLLFLGDRFLWGEKGGEELSLPAQVAKGTGGVLVEGGPPAFNLAQMLLLARKAVPQSKPDFIILQYSTWLIDRSLSPYLESPAGRMTVAHFSDAADGRIEVSPPPFAAGLGDSRFAGFSRTPPTALDEVKFFTQAAFPLLFRDEFHHLSYRARRLTRQIPGPTQRRLAAVRLAYNSIAKLGNKTGAKVLFLLLGRLDQNDLQVLAEIMPASLISTGESVQKRFSTESSGPLSSQYQQWQAYPQVFSDQGFPRDIHRTIAPQVVEAILQVKHSFDAPFKD